MRDTIYDYCECGKRCWRGWYLCEQCLISLGIIRPGFNPYES